MRVKAQGDLTDAELDEALDVLVSRTQSQEISSLQQLESISMSLQKFSVPVINQCSTISEEIINKSEGLKNTIRNYFQSDHLLNSETICKSQVSIYEMIFFFSYI